MDDEFETIRGAHFGKEEVPADGREFVDCTFDGSALIFRGTAPFVVGEGSGNFVVVFTEHAETTLAQLAAMYRFGQGPLVEQFINRIRNPFEDTMQ